MEQSDIVSVVIPTYNREEFIIETLDSIYNQTYPFIELIITDDGSSDKTIELCREWFAFHGSRFIRIHLLTVSHNTGISANRNRGEKQAIGHWIKAMDSDDILLPNAITEYVEFISQHREITYLFAKVNIFGNDSKKVNSSERNQFSYDIFNLSIKEQHNFLIEKIAFRQTLYFSIEKRMKKLVLFAMKAFP